MYKTSDIFKSVRDKIHKQYGESRDVSAGDFAPGLAAGGGTALAYKGYSDLGNIQSKLNKWEEVMGAHGDSLQFQNGVQHRLLNKINSRIKNPLARDNAIARVKASPIFGGEHYTNPGISSKVIDDYIVHGSNLAKSKFLGIPSGKILELMRRGDPAAVNHYRLFSDKNVHIDEIRHHMMEKALGYRDAEAYWGRYNHKTLPDTHPIFTDEMKRVMQEPGTVASRLSKFERQFPSTHASNILRNAITGVPGSRDVNNIGEALRLAGNNSSVLSTPKVYAKNINDILGPVGHLKNPILAAGTLLTGGLLASPFFKKKADLSSPTDVAGGGAGLGIGALLGSMGVNKLTPNKNIGVTYGEMTGPYGIGDVGSGHKAPALALKSLLQDEINRPGSPISGYNVDEIVRNKAGLILQDPKHYNTILDTGLGRYTQGWEHGTERTHRAGLPSGIHADSRMPMQSDATAFDRMHRMGATTNPVDKLPHEVPKSIGGFFDSLKKLKYLFGQHNYMGYGDNFEQAASQKGYSKNNWMPWRQTKVSEGLTPAVNKDILDILHTPQTREQVFGNLANHYSTTNPDLAAKFKSGLDGAKRVVAISGSGRGDYVASRAKQLADALRANGVSDTRIVAQLSGALDDPKQMALLKEYPEIVSTGRMPMKDFVNLQRTSDLHWGSAGTSSLAESLLQDTPFALPKDWGYRKWHHSGGGSHITPNTPAEYHGNLMEQLGHGKEHGQIPITSWNRGNMQYAHKQPGVLAADSADDIVKLLTNNDSMTAMREGAKTRASAELAKLMEGRKNVVNTVISEVLRNNKINKFKGGGLLGLAGGAAGLGAYMLGRKPQSTDDFLKDMLMQGGSSLN